MLLRIPFTLFLASAFVVGASAQDGRLSKAGAVVDAMLEIDSREQAKLAAEDMLRQTREYEFRTEYEEFLISVSQAPEYRAAKARAFAEAFTEQELEEILALAKNPVFRKYQERTPALQRASRIALTEAMRPSVMEFAQRIEALKQARAKK